MPAGSQKGATENGKPDNVAPNRRGGHRETCFNVRVSAH